MDVDFNNVRIQAMHAYNRLVKTLNSGIELPKVKVFVEDIEEDLNDLRQLIGVMACTFKKDDPDFKMVYTDDITLLCFNEEKTD
jgi:hypothetical protein